MEKARHIACLVGLIIFMVIFYPLLATFFISTSLVGKILQCLGKLGDAFVEKSDEAASAFQSILSVLDTGLGIVRK